LILKQVSGNPRGLQRLLLASTRIQLPPRRSLMSVQIGHIVRPSEPLTRVTIWDTEWSRVNNSSTKSKPAPGSRAGPEGRGWGRSFVADQRARRGQGHREEHRRRKARTLPSPAPQCPGQVAWPGIGRRSPADRRRVAPPASPAFPVRPKKARLIPKKGGLLSINAGIHSLKCGILSLNAAIYSLNCGIFSLNCGIHSLNCGIYSSISHWDL